MKPILFLDIDGVINPFIPTIVEVDNENLAQELAVKYHNNNILKLDKQLVTNVYHCFDKEACEYIKKLCNQFDAQIIVTSSWRLTFNIIQLEAILDIHGLGKYVIGCTSDQYNRVKEIKERIQTLHIKRYIVIDDIDMTKAFHRRMICTKKIFTKNDYQKAQLSLNKQKKMGCFYF